MPKRLAVLTIGVLHEPMGHPRVQGFVDRIPGVFEAAEISDGFIDRSRRDEVMDHSWGEVIAPKCFGVQEDLWKVPSTLSLWNDIESVLAFAYHGAHGEAMPKRKEWFTVQEEPTYALWWVENEDRIDWGEASARLDHLHEIGPTPFAFDFKSPFDSEGKPYSIDTATLRTKTAANAARAGKVLDAV